MIPKVSLVTNIRHTPETGDTRERRHSQVPRNVGLDLFWFLHFLHARRWGSVIHIYNSALPTILLALHNFEMTTHVQDWDILKVARMALLHPDYLQTIKMSYSCTWVVTSTWSAPIESADKQNPPIWLPFVCCRNLEKLKPCLLSKRRHRSNGMDRRDLREKRDRGETERKKR